MPKLKNKISVIIPLYNQSRYIGSAVDSILSQSYDNLEIIIVNDGSTDDSLSRLDRYGKKIAIINQEILACLRREMLAYWHLQASMFSFWMRTISYIRTN